MSEQVIYRTGDGVAELRFNRAEKKNAITADMYAAMADGLARAEGDEAVRAVIIGGEGGAFTAGNDLADFLQRPAQAEDTPPVRRFMTALSRAEKPVVAAVDGLAIGIGTTLLLHCDLVVASTRAKFQTPFVNLGLVPEFASSLLLPARVGPQRAAELLLLADMLDAETAHRFGLVNRVVEPDALEAAAMEFAQRLAAKPPEALRQSKRLMRADPATIDTRIAEENEVFARQLRSPEAREAFQAFLEKRAPDVSRRA
jgi:enoyl-CoA hydratase/carnithine racemase